MEIELIVTAMFDLLGDGFCIAQGLGLERDWYGRVFLDLGPAAIDECAWVRKLMTELNAGRISEFLAIVPARPEMSWWCELNACHPFVCFSPRGLAVVYHGENFDKFYAGFEPLGQIYQRIHPALMFGA